MKGLLDRVRHGLVLLLNLLYNLIRLISINGDNLLGHPLLRILSLLGYFIGGIL
jgi:hypothetical protein